MPISLSTLQSAAKRYSDIRAYSEFSCKQTAFLCHSHKDGDLAKGLQVLLKDSGWDIYIDWQDDNMPEQPNKETATRIKNKIGSSDWFLYLATPNSSNSKWCPWEIGIADTKKPYDRILIIATTDTSGRWYGNEYLQLYKQITFANDNNLAAFPAGKLSEETYVKNLR